MPSLVGSEMCIRDRATPDGDALAENQPHRSTLGFATWVSKKHTVQFGGYHDYDNGQIQTKRGGGATGTIVEQKLCQKLLADGPIWLRGREDAVVVGEAHVLGAEIFMLRYSWFPRGTMENDCIIRRCPPFHLMFFVYLFGTTIVYFEVYVPFLCSTSP